MQFALAVDIGGTKATVATIDTAFNILARREISTGSAPDLEPALAAATNEVLQTTTGQLKTTYWGTCASNGLTTGNLNEYWILATFPTP